MVTAEFAAQIAGIWLKYKTDDSAKIGGKFNWWLPIWGIVLSVDSGCGGCPHYAVCPTDRSRSRFLNDKLILPFEGDSLLSVILSKAFLLANDSLSERLRQRAITDPSIISQIKSI